MSYSFVIIDKKNELNLQEFTHFCDTVCDEYEIIYASSKLIKKDMVKNFVFHEDENVEKIINVLVNHCTKKNLILIRDVARYQDVKKLIDGYKKSNQIVFLKKEQSKFKAFWFNSVKNTIAKMLSHQLMPIDYSVVLYGEITFKVLKNVKAPSVLMRTNNFTGIDYVLLDGGKSYKFAYQKKKLALTTIIPSVIAVVLIILYFVLFKLNATLTVFYFALISILLIVSFIIGSKWILNHILGDNITEKAIFQEYNDNKENKDNSEI